MLAVAFGVAGTVAASRTTLDPAAQARPAAAAVQTSTPSPPPASPTPKTPGPLKPGVLGDSPALGALGASLLVAQGATTLLSRDGGKSWSRVQAPGPVQAAGPNSPWLSGGSKLMVSHDLGASWHSPQNPAPAPFDYVPLLVSPYDPDVWFILHHGALLRTRDGGVSWLDLASVGSLTAPVIIPGGVTDRFYLASGDRLMELIDNGQQVVALPGLPYGASFAALAVVSAGTPGVLLARGSDGVVYQSAAGGWQPVPANLHGPILSIPGKVALIGDGARLLSAAGQVDYSTDGGQSWTAASGLPPNESVEALAASPDGATLFAYCYGGDLYSSSDLGRQWSLVSSSLRSQA